MGDHDSYFDPEGGGEGDTAPVEAGGADGQGRLDARRGGAAERDVETGRMLPGRSERAGEGELPHLTSAGDEKVGERLIEEKLYGDGAGCMEPHGDVERQLLLIAAGVG